MIYYLVAGVILSASFHVDANQAASRIRTAIEKYKAGRYVVPTAPNRTPVIDAEVPAPKHFGTDVIEKPYFRLYARCASKVSPYTAYAIAVHETGNFRSRLWRTANNPGGIKYWSFKRRGSGMDFGKCGAYASFRTPEEGIQAHAMVLASSRYRAAHGTSDPVAQVVAIGNGGYAEYSPSWTTQVCRYVTRLIGRPVAYVKRRISRRKKPDVTVID